MKLGLIEHKKLGLSDVYVYRHPIIAGMEFCYPGLKNHKMKVIGFYDYQIIISSEGNTLSEKTINKVIF